jgi:L-aspartate oxidase
MIKCDFLVIGSGITGLTFAHKAASKGTVTIVTKKEKSDANTNYAQGGIASIFSPDDSFKLHSDDTIRAGDGLCNRPVVEKMVREGPKLVGELMDFGVEFSMQSERGRGALDLGMEGGHSRRRIVHSKDLTGKTIESALLHTVKGDKNISMFENHTAIDLITDDAENPKQCGGVYIIENETGKVFSIYARIVLVASGGAGQLYLHTTNPSIATGDGVAMAFRAGVPVSNMEFIQFHPTSLYEEQEVERAFLISEAVRGEGAFLKTVSGETFMEHYHPRKSLAPRDIVARAIDAEMMKSGDKYVLLDTSPIGKRRFKKRFPTIHKTLVDKGIFPVSDAIPVVPAAHYLCGGIAVKPNAKTHLKGLYAAGEVAFTGVHGANRLASNSLLEALVFSEGAYRSAGREFKKFAHIDKKIGLLEKRKRKKLERSLIVHNREVIRRIMWDYVGIVRTERRLEEALKRIRTIKEEVETIFKQARIAPELIELRNMATVSELITYSALKRKESRGLHYMADYPQKDDKRWKKNTTLVKKVLEKGRKK